MNTIRRIIDTEIEYLKCFSNFSDKGNIIRFSDDFILDMYSHNLTYLKQPILRKDFCDVVDGEIGLSKEKGRNFLNIQFDFEFEKVNACIKRQNCEVLIAREHGAKIIYLITDSDDTAKEMYKKCGMIKVGEKTELIYSF